MLRVAIGVLSGLGLLAAAPAPAPSTLELRWELMEDVFPSTGGEGASRVAVTLTNRGPQPLGARGWGLYWTSMHQPRPQSVEGPFRFEEVTGDLQRILPTAEFTGLAPGRSIRFEYVTFVLPNVSFIPTQPYVVFDEAPEAGHLLRYVGVPFERGPSPNGPRVVTPAAQYELDQTVKDLPRESLPPVFPTPALLEARAGRVRLDVLPTVSAAPGLEAEARLATDYLRPHVPRSAGATGAGTITGASTLALRLETGEVPGQDSAEAYELIVDSAVGIRIRGRSAAGVFYGLQSLRSLLPPAPPAASAPGAPAAAGPSLPALRIVDAPRFGYRGLMLDVARNFHPKAEVLRVLDLMARYKLNVFHFHLTEDEGWRVEIASLPELTSVGARRGHTLDSRDFLPPAFGSGPHVDRPFGSGFYSKADYIEILRYAAARHIEVVPEIEMPGHARAAIKAMEARARRLRTAGDAEGAGRYLLSDPDDRSVYTSAQRYHDNVMNPALPSTYAFIERVVQDLVALHREAGVPLRNLHVGGDEVPPGVWEGSPLAQAYMKEHGLLRVDDFWFLFYGRVAEILKANGLVPSGWEEIALRKTRLDGRDTFIPNPGFADRGWRTYVWNNIPGGGTEDLAYRLANGGFKVVLCPVTHMYFDLAANPNPEEPGLVWGGYVDVDEPFGFVPFDYYKNLRVDRRGQPLPGALFVGKDRLTDYGKQNILGLQANLWAETLGGEGRLDYMLVPKVFGLAERAWSQEPAWAREKDEARSRTVHQEAWSEFVNVIGKRELPRLERESPAWRYRIPTPGLTVVDGQVRSSLAIPGFVLRYTTDGTEPTARSPEMRGPIPWGPLLRVAAFDGRGRKGRTVKP